MKDDKSIVSDYMESHFRGEHEFPDPFRPGSRIWFRIHTLPESKRYPDDSMEMDEILTRHNALVSDLFGEGSPYFLVTSGYSKSIDPVRSYAQLEPFVRESQYWFSREEDGIYWHYFLMRRRWISGLMDELLRAIANDDLRYVWFLNLDRQCFYHPYDGGADLFIMDDTRREEFRLKYLEWLPKNNVGM